jgi:hypothetical protein
MYSKYTSTRRSQGDINDPPAEIIYTPPNNCSAENLEGYGTSLTFRIDLACIFL